jgi:sarcosine oxidase subunit gamma
MADPTTVTTLAPATRFSVRGPETAISAISSAVGVEFPRQPCRAAEEGLRAALWLGPDEWLFIAPDSERDAMELYLGSVTAVLPASAVDISDRQVGIALTGAHAIDALAAFMPLDLEPTAFPLGMCTRTVFGKAEIVLWRQAIDAFRIEVWRSFAPYVLACLDEALLEHRQPLQEPAS